MISIPLPGIIGLVAGLVYRSLLFLPGMPVQTEFIIPQNRKNEKKNNNRGHIPAVVVT
jgi:hypothetical protein